MVGAIMTVIKASLPFVWRMHLNVQPTQGSQSNRIFQSSTNLTQTYSYQNWKISVLSGKFFKPIKESVTLPELQGGYFRYIM